MQSDTGQASGQQAFGRAANSDPAVFWLGSGVVAVFVVRKGGSWLGMYVEGIGYEQRKGRAEVH
jgi:hypothetical protein